MKKLIYILLFFSITATVLSSCTEEEVKPTTDLSENGGGSGVDDTKPKN